MSNRWKNVVLGMCAAIAFSINVPSLPAQQAGTLLVDLKGYTSSVKLSGRLKKQLTSAGLSWGMMGNTLVVSTVNERYLRLDAMYLTRFGEQRQLELAPGDYTIACIAYNFESVSRNVETALARNAFFNPGVLKFTIAPGKQTTLEISSDYKAQSHFGEKMYLPDLTVSVLEDGMQTGEPVMINRWGTGSVAWDNYHGPLKY